MKFFVDTADTKDIAELAATGLIDGVTTNPSLIAKSGRPFAEVIKEICALTSGPVSAEVVATDAEGMVSGRKRDAVLFGKPGATRRQSGRGFYLAIHRPPR